MSEKKSETALEIATRLAKALDEVNEIIHGHNFDAPEGEIPLVDIVAELPNVKEGLDIPFAPENFIIGDAMELIYAVARNEFGDNRRGFVVAGIISNENKNSFLKIVPNGGITVTVGDLSSGKSDELTELFDVICGRDFSKKTAKAVGNGNEAKGQ